MILVKIIEPRINREKFLFSKILTNNNEKVEITKIASIPKNLLSLK